MVIKAGSKGLLSFLGEKILPVQTKNKIPVNKRNTIFFIENQS
jgi:hypothetical protein